ncbi:hypothetical protein [Treponema sp.]|uniref:hypothetical protein n=1 Tax=Treponema sp. TaxID=166 RepID=UPI0025E88352|nr:hypothetical protein [Treponema sp.]MCR5219102.1 hypothetical protein [Treponema sp.]
MANITQESREDFADKAKPVKAKIEESLKKEKDILTVMKRDSGGVEYKKLLLCEEMIYVATLYISINSLSVTILETKNNDALNDARKMIYKAVIYLEEVVSNVVDCPYSEIEPKLQTISNTPLEKRFYLVRKLGLVTQMLVDAFGDNSKWKWSFVELRGRFAVVAKNLLDMKQAAKDYYDPRSSDYEDTVKYIRLLKKILDRSASEYRDRYELSTRRIDDMRMAINFLIALRRIAMILGEKEDSEEIRKKAVVWKEKMENDQKTGASR